MEEPRSYPLWKEALKHVLQCAENNREPFVTFNDMEKLLEAPKDTPEYNFAVMALVKMLRTEHGVVLLRCRGLGYKVTTEKEKVREAVPRYDRQIKSKLRTQGEILDTIVPEKLDEEDKQFYDRQVVHYGLTRAFLGQLIKKDTPMTIGSPTERVKLEDHINQSSVG
jgi:hypothetical protein